MAGIRAANDNIADLHLWLTVITLWLKPNVTRLSTMCRHPFSRHMRMDVDLHVHSLAELI